MNRIEERNTAFKLIFSMPFNGDKTVDEVIELYKQANDIDSLSDYVVNTVRGVFDNLTYIDEKINSSIKSRKLSRLDSVCLAAMRLAVYEIVYNDDIPTSVAINEAIELTKKYDDSLAAFVHGNLSLIAENCNE